MQGGIFNNLFTTNLPKNLPVKNENWSSFDKIMVMSLWPHFLAHTVHVFVLTIELIVQLSVSFFLLEDIESLLLSLRQKSQTTLV